MGTQLLDQYSLLHFAAGVVAYFWGVPAVYWVLSHVAFELSENTETGMRFINKNLTWWPGGKPRKDSVINIVGDTVSALCGWYVAFWLDELGKLRGWYN